MTILLLIFGFFLIIINIIALRKEDKSFDKVINNAKENVENYDIEIMRLRKEMGETILELQQEIETLKMEIALNKESIVEDVEIEEPIYEEVFHDKIEKKNNVKIDEVKHLLDEGMSLEDICERLQIGKGELLLIKELYLK